MPIDARRNLAARGVELIGLIARRLNFKKFPILTESMCLALDYSERTITTETPSEYDMGQRIRAQIAMIQRASN